MDREGRVLGVAGQSKGFGDVDVCVADATEMQNSFCDSRRNSLTISEDLQNSLYEETMTDDDASSSIASASCHHCHNFPSSSSSSSDSSTSCGKRFFSSTLISSSSTTSSSSVVVMLAMVSYCLITPFVTFSNKKLFSSSVVSLPFSISFAQQAVVMLMLLLSSCLFCLFFATSDKCNYSGGVDSDVTTLFSRDSSYSLSTRASLSSWSSEPSLTFSFDGSGGGGGVSQTRGYIFYFLLTFLSSFRSLLFSLAHFVLCSVGPLNLSLSTAITVFPSTVLFVAMISFSNLCLDSVPVSSYQVARSSSLIFNIFLSATFLGEKISVSSFVACLLVGGGFGVASCDPQTLTLRGGLMGCAASFFGALYMTLCKLCIRTFQKKQQQQSTCDVKLKKSCSNHTTTGSDCFDDSRSSKVDDDSNRCRSTSNDDRQVCDDDVGRRHGEKTTFGKEAVKMKGRDTEEVGSNQHFCRVVENARVDVDNNDSSQREGEGGEGRPASLFRVVDCRICHQSRTANIEAILILHISAMSVILFIPLMFFGGEMQRVWIYFRNLLEIGFSLLSWLVEIISSFPSSSIPPLEESLQSSLCVAAYVGGLIIATGLLAALIPFTTYTCLKHTSPLVCNIIGFVKTCTQTVGGVILFGDVISVQGLVGIGLCVAGCFWFSHVKYCENPTKSKRE